MSAPLPRLGFLGLGWIGRNRLEAIASSGLAEIAALSDPVPELVTNAAAIAPVARRCATLEELLAENLDGLVIATPSALHAEQSTRALEAGCAVFCQKPLGRDAAEVRAIVDTARRADRLLGVDLSYRHLVGMERIRELIRDGELGTVFAVDLVFHNAYGPDKPWFYDARLSGGGCVIDLGIHLVDAALWVLETSVVEVSSRVLAQGQPLQPDGVAVEDFASARIDLASGAVVNLACSWKLHAGQHAVIEVAFYGTRGGAALRNVDGTFLDFRAERFHATHREVLAHPPDDWSGRAGVAWVRQLAGSRKFDPAIEQQIEVATVLDAIYGRASAAHLLAPRHS